ncbi:ATP-binding cassette domain-containing protein [Glycomyces arizonensis]|uniref:ATP-binding cassette domain-containing protein n=1 Tax=Glycomyces arizonensis TaxID=256035 RepID=UPI000404AF59|nr:ATP-binding cassette domain-containing protein [Glycomyces arizonensis]
MVESAAIAVRDLTKAYTETAGLFGVSLDVEAGSVMALLGPNGAGKTTVVRILSTLLRPDSGSVSIGGVDALARPEAVRAVIGVANQSAAVDQKLTGQANLAMFARLHRLPRTVARQRSAELLELFDLTGAAGKPVKRYSGGMRRKLDLAVSLIGRPSILFLDEPTTGLDPASRLALWEIIGGLLGQGTTVLLTTQYLDEADALAHDVTFIDGGRVIARGTPGELKSRIGGRRVDLTPASAALVPTLAGRLSGFEATTGDRALHVSIGDALADLRRLLDAVDASGIPLEDYRVRTPTLDDVYFHVTGHERPAGAETRKEDAA